MNTYFKKACELIGLSIKYCCLAHCTLEYVGDIVLCVGPSMEPTILSEDIILTDRISARWGRFNRNDIVISINPSNPKEHICKRIKGVAGDKIYYGLSSITVPQGHVWLEGDNSNISYDSRSFGPVPQGLLRSRALYKLWPMNFRKDAFDR